MLHISFSGGPLDGTVMTAVDEQPTSDVWLNLPGVHTKIISSGFPYVAHGLMVDPLGRKLYWTNQNLGAVYTANLDGTGIQQIATGYGSIQGIVVGPAIPEPTDAFLGSLACVFALAVRRSQAC